MAIKLHADCFTNREWAQITRGASPIRLDHITEATPCRTLKAASGHKITVVQYF